MPKTLRCEPSLFEKDLSGKVIIVTGCTSGTGLFTAGQLVKQKATVVMASRNTEKGEATASKAGGVFMRLDLASLQSVRDFCKQFLAGYDRLDVLVNNAGVMVCPLSHTPDGFEMQMGTNHFGHFLLTELLRDILEKSAPSRVVNLASCGAAPCSPQITKLGCEIDFADLHWQTRKYEKGEAYAQSKLANVLHAQEIAKRYKGVTAYSLHPGWVKTELMRHIAPGCCVGCIQCCCSTAGNMINAEDGSQTSLHCILSEASDLENGAFYSQFGIYKDKASQKGGWPMKLPNPIADDPATAQRLWERSRDLVGLGSADAAAEVGIVEAPGQEAGI